MSVGSQWLAAMTDSLWPQAFNISQLHSGWRNRAFWHTMLYKAAELKTPHSHRLRGESRQPLAVPAVQTKPLHTRLPSACPGLLNITELPQQSDQSLQTCYISTAVRITACTPNTSEPLWRSIKYQLVYVALHSSAAVSSPPRLELPTFTTS